MPTPQFISHVTAVMSVTKKVGAIVTSHQASILDDLDIQKPVTFSKLAEHLGIGRSAMSIHAGRLVRRGYIRRSTVRGDYAR